MGALAWDRRHPLGGLPPPTVCPERKQEAAGARHRPTGGGRQSEGPVQVPQGSSLGISPSRDCNKVQEKRGAVYERIATANQEIQKIRAAVQQLRETTEREKLRSQVSADGESTSGHLWRPQVPGVGCHTGTASGAQGSGTTNRSLSLDQRW